MGQMTWVCRQDLVCGPETEHYRSVLIEMLVGWGFENSMERLVGELWLQLQPSTMDKHENT